MKSTFRAAYDEVIARDAAKPFLVCYQGRNERIAVTFADFDRDVRLAARTLSNDTGVVMLIWRNTYEGVAFAVAALLLGRTLCPVNPEEGAERIREKIKLIGEKVSVWSDQKDLARELNAQLLTFKTAGPGEFRDFAPDQPFALIFTSGSTGYSKIVEQTEQGALENVADTIAHFGLGPNVCVATPLPTFHVNAMFFGLFGALLSGGRLVLWEKFQLPLVLSSLRTEKVDILSVVPSILRLLAQPLVNFRKEVPDLKYIVTAAAPLSVELVKLAKENIGAPIIQGYGLSEAINFSCLMPLGLSEAEYERWMMKGEFPSIGPVVHGNEVVLLDEENQPVAEGEPGEICIRGNNVMRGYRGDTERAVMAGGYLHTGDLARVESDASGRAFHFVIGRKKDIVKRFGMTISLREIDDMLGAFNEANFDAIAVAFENDWTGEDVGLVVTRNASWTPERQQRLKAHLTKIPAHLRPRVVMTSERELRTASGKPCRWMFTPLFARFRTVMLSQNIAFFKEESALTSE